MTGSRLTAGRLPGRRLGLGAFGVLFTVLALGAGVAGAAGSDWLTEINRYREAAGLADVSEQPAWDLGLEHHLAYLVKTPKSLFSGAYASAHTENPSSPYYTADGASEAGYSDLSEGGSPSALAAVDGWLTAPFHAIGMLRAGLRSVALADDPATGFAGLDVIQGIDTSAPASSAPILFPGPGITTNLTRFGPGEYPDPTETCGWQGQQVGLPLIAMLPGAPAPGLSATVSTSGGTESSTAGNLCIVDATTFRTSDSVYGPNGRAILEGDHAVLLIPHAPLPNGSVSATITQPGQPDITWSFTARGAVVPPIAPGHAVVLALAPIQTAGRPVTLGFVTLRGFIATLNVSSARGVHLGTFRFRLPIGSSSLRVRLPASATRSGRSVVCVLTGRVAGHAVRVQKAVRFR